MLNANVKNYRRGLIVSQGNLNGNEGLGAALDRYIHGTGLVLVSEALPFLLFGGRELMFRSPAKNAGFVTGVVEKIMVNSSVPCDVSSVMKLALPSL